MVRSAAEIHAENRERIQREREEMARRWGAPKPEKRSAIKKIKEAIGEATVTVTSTEKKCLACQEPFRSTGKNNRLCARCRRRREGVSI